MSRSSSVLSRSTNIPLGKKELVALLLLSSECHVSVIVLGLFLAKPLSGPRREETCLRGFRQSEFQTGLLSCKD